MPFNTVVWPFVGDTGKLIMYIYSVINVEIFIIILIIEICI